jgi:2-polyprenyl-3-methyl-5-hydroxy-6-metoxy-1,4-benzoquinol methylase
MQAGQVTDEERPERFDPADDAGKLVHSEHIARYRWAGQATAGVDVLDAGCGTGYGTAILAGTKPARLLAVDLDQEAVERTRAAVGDAAEVSRADVRELPLEDDAVDVVVCFEVIEHLERRDQALRELARVLRPGGVLLISSPNRNRYPPGNPHHVYEYTPEELEQELGEHFAHVRVQRQHAWLASAVAADEDLAAEDGVAATMLTPADDVEEESFSVASASDGELPRMAPCIVIGDAFEVRWWNDQLDHWRRTAQEWQRNALGTGRELHERSERLRELGLRLLEIEQENARLMTESRDLAHELETERYRRERADGVIADLQGSFSWKLTAPLRRAKERLGRRR